MKTHNENSCRREFLKRMIQVSAGATVSGGTISVIAPRSAVSDETTPKPSLAHHPTSTPPNPAANDDASPMSSSRWLNDSCRTRFECKNCIKDREWQEHIVSSDVDDTASK